MIISELVEIENIVIILKNLINRNKISDKQLSLELDVLKRRTNELYMKNLLNQSKGDD